ncbi:hypothetical protein HWV62_1793 [Athelia sp. TMB]|nr:hypothetical protein HWV62_1793 [Athelia sp. TMB]
MVRHTPAALILDFCRAHIAEHEVERIIFAEPQDRDDEQYRLLSLQLARARCEYNMYMSAMPAGILVTDAICRDDVPCAHSSTISIVLVKRTIRSTPLGLQMNFLQGRWDEHRFETALRKSRLPDARHQIRLVKLKLSRLCAEIKLYNASRNMSTASHGKVAAVGSLDAVDEMSEGED